MAELADAPDSKSGGRKVVWVRFPPSAFRCAPNWRAAALSTGLHLAPEVKVVHLDDQGHHAGRAALGMDHSFREVGGLSGPDRGLVRPLSDPAGSIDWHEELTEPGFMKSDPAARTEPKNTDMGLTLPECHRRSMGTDAVVNPRPGASRGP